MKNGGVLRLMSRTAANDEVTTTRFTLLFGLAAAERIERTPFIAGIMSSFSLSFVS